jgi:hypothetical protein
MSERPRMFIGWLRPLQGLTTNEHILFCTQLTSDSVDKEQVLWFDEKKNEPELAHWCDVAKRRACIQNTFKWLESGRLDPFGEKKIGYKQMWIDLVEIMHLTILPKTFRKAMNF